MRVAVLTGAIVAAVPSPFALDINTILTILGAAGGGAAAWKIVGLLLDKIVPSRSDKRSDVETSLGALSKTIEILSQEKASDAAAVARANARIAELEREGAADYDVIRVLKEAKDDLERRIIAKDQHIATLSAHLADYGARVTFDGNGHLRVDTAPRTGTGPIHIVQ